MTDKQTGQPSRPVRIEESEGKRYAVYLVEDEQGRQKEVRKEILMEG